MKRPKLSKSKYDFSKLAVGEYFVAPMEKLGSLRSLSVHHGARNFATYSCRVLPTTSGKMELRVYRTA